VDPSAIRLTFRGLAIMAAALCFIAVGHAAVSGSFFVFHYLTAR
jgi:hypothetical protein